MQSIPFLNVTQKITVLRKLKVVLIVILVIVTIRGPLNILKIVNKLSLYYSGRNNGNTRLKIKQIEPQRPYNTRG